MKYKTISIILAIVCAVLLINTMIQYQWNREMEGVLYWEAEKTILEMHPMRYRGCTWFESNGSSMKPTLGDHVDWCGVHPRPEDIYVGDIIAFWSETKQDGVIHRVYQITPEGYVVMGDSNIGPDEEIVPYKNIDYKVVMTRVHNKDASQ